MQVNHEKPLNWDWGSLLQNEIHNMNEDARTGFPAKVIGINSQGLSVTVQILNPRFDDAGENMDEAPVLNVPVSLIRSGTSIVYFPVKVGDTGFCMVADNNIDNFKQSGNTLATQVNNNRMKDVMDAVFVPGLAPFTVTSQQYQALKLPKNLEDLMLIHNTGTAQEAQIAIKADGDIKLTSQFTVGIDAKDIELNASNSVSINASSLSVNVATTTWTGNNTITGAWTFNGIPFDTHKHVGVTPGSGTSGLPRA
jgi:hypothetical protein